MKKKENKKKDRLRLFFLVVVLIFSFFHFSKPVFADITNTCDNVKALYYFNGNMNDSRIDVSDINNGYCSGINCPVLIADRFGYSSKAYSFDGVDDSITVNVNNGLKITDELTVSAWVFPRSAPTGKGTAIASTYNWNNGGVNQRGWNFGEDWGSDDRLSFKAYSPTGIELYISNDQFFSNHLNKWTHVAITYKGGSNAFAKLYINGVKVIDKSSGVISSIGYSASTPLRIGARGDSGSTANWNGLIDDLIIHNKALSDLEIQQIYLSNNGVICAPSICSDQQCTGNEDCNNCPQDCGNCPICGDGFISGNEVCDRTNLGIPMRTCLDEGYNNGDLSCSLNCLSFDTSQCGPSIGNPNAKIYYIDNTNGNDNYNGLSQSSAWKTIAKVNSQFFNPGDSILFKRGEVWREKLFITSSGNESDPITYGAYGTGDKPLFLGSISQNNPSDWTNIGKNLWATADNLFPSDVGFMIMGPDVTSSVGAKFWQLSDLDVEREYWRDVSKKRIVVYSDQNPATKYYPIEIARSNNVSDFLIVLGSKRYVHIQDIALKYGDNLAIHIAGDARGTEIRNCDIGFIGGALLQMLRGGTTPCRFGNGIQLYTSGHDILVDGCKIWQVYDAGLTFQAGSENINQYNIYFTNNIIWYTEYSLEIFNRGPNSKWWNNHFENNIMIGAGYGWGHDRRADITDSPNNDGFGGGYNIRSTDLVTSADGIYFTDNVFYEAKTNNLWHERAQIDNFVIDNNYYYQKLGNMIDFFGFRYPMSQFSSYQNRFQKDLNSVTGDKILVRNAARSKVSSEDLPLINKLFQEVDGNCEGITCFNCLDDDFDGFGAIGTDLSGCSGSTTIIDCDDNNPDLTIGCNNYPLTDININGKTDIQDIRICMNNFITQDKYYSNCSSLAEPVGSLDLNDVREIVKNI